MFYVKLKSAAQFKRHPRPPFARGEDWDYALSGGVSGLIPCRFSDTHRRTIPHRSSGVL